MADTIAGSATFPALGSALAASHHHPALLITRRGEILFANPCALDLLGVPAGDLSGVLLSSLLVPQDVPTLERLLSSREPTAPMLLRAVDDGGAGIRAMIVTASVVLGGDEEIIVLFGREASAELVREARVRTAERFELVGQLATGVAHELNNALSIVTTFGDLLLAKADSASSDAQDLREIKEAALNAAAVMRKLDLFSGGGAMTEPEEVHLQDIVQGCRKLLVRFFTRGVTLTVDLDEAAPPVRSTPLRMEEVLFSLAANARDALGGSGSVRVSVRRGGTEGAPTAILGMADSASGPRPPSPDEAVEAFFSTRPLGQGTGLGLARVARVVNVMGGSFRLESLAGGGVEASVELPAAS